jgi:hypothetical protein
MLAGVAISEISAKTTEQRDKVQDRFKAMHISRPIVGPGEGAARKG